MIKKKKKSKKNPKLIHSANLEVNVKSKFVPDDKGLSMMSWSDIHQSPSQTSSS